MITDSQTNTVYYSNQSIYGLKEEVFALRTILKDHDIQSHNIIGTKDYFCRDYMPFQIDPDTFIQFRFEPDYLLKNPDQKQYYSKVSLVHQKNEFLKNLKIIHSDIVLDGGNLIKGNDKVIITDKVFLDNPEISAESLIDKLSEVLKCQVIIIPRFPGEETGHADGLIRFIDNNKALSICLAKAPHDWVYCFKKALEYSNIELISLPKVSDNDSEFAWGYINYLQVGKLIVLPAFGNESDLIMVEYFKSLFPECTVKTMDARRIIKDGGVLNCFTWNISQKM